MERKLTRELQLAASISPVGFCCVLWAPGLIMSSLSLAVCAYTWKPHSRRHLLYLGLCLLGTLLTALKGPVFPVAFCCLFRAIDLMFCSLPLTIYSFTLTCYTLQIHSFKTYHTSFSRLYWIASLGNIYYKASKVPVSLNLVLLCQIHPVSLQITTKEKNVTQC